MENTIYLLVPAYNPTTALVETIKCLRHHTNIPIVIVNDGSDMDCQAIFKECETQTQVKVISHALNLGKGAALKTGFDFILQSDSGCDGVVTFDADGQHLPKCIVQVIDQFLSGDCSDLVMGVRAFDKKVPLRSRLGNLLTSKIFQALYSIPLSDTQTGLRGIPRALMAASLKILSNRYEFEFEQLIVADTLGIRFDSIEIRTIYLDNNSSSHFHPIFDSARIYLQLFRYFLGSIVTTFFEFFIFLAFVFFLTENIVVATLMSRFVAALIQYIISANNVFNVGYSSVSFISFISYVAFMGTVSGNLQLVISDQLGLYFITSKLISEISLFIFNFLVLRNFIFRGKREFVN